METGKVMTQAETAQSIAQSKLGDEVIKFEELKIVAKLDVPTGKRLCRIINKKGIMSVGAHVPVISNESLINLMDNEIIKQFILDSLHGMQDKIVRTFVMDKENKDRIIDTNEVLTEGRLISFIWTEQETKGRVSKDAIEAWFTADLAPLIVTALQAKGIVQKAQIEATVAAYKNYFGSLAGRNISMSEKVKLQLEKALALLPDNYESAIAEKVAEKLIEVREQVADIDAL